MSVREDVYGVLTRLAEERGVSVSDVVADLINCCLGNAVSLSRELSEIRDLLRQCLDRLGRQQITTQLNPQPVSTADRTGESAKSLPGLEGNPWVQIIRARVGGNEGGGRA